MQSLITIGVLYDLYEMTGPVSRPADRLLTPGKPSEPHTLQPLPSLRCPSKLLRKRLTRETERLSRAEFGLTKQCRGGEHAGGSILCFRLPPTSSTSSTSSQRGKEATEGRRFLSLRPHFILSHPNLPHR